MSTLDGLDDRPEFAARAVGAQVRVGFEANSRNSWIPIDAGGGD